MPSFLHAYKSYKAWWIGYHGPTNGTTQTLKDINEEAFEDHINSMSLYTLMETLEMWSDD